MQVGRCVVFGFFSLAPLDWSPPLCAAAVRTAAYRPTPAFAVYALWGISRKIAGQKRQKRPS